MSRLEASALFRPSLSSWATSALEKRSLPAVTDKRAKRPRHTSRLGDCFAILSRPWQAGTSMTCFARITDSHDPAAPSRVISITHDGAGHPTVTHQILARLGVDCRSCKLLNNRKEQYSPPVKPTEDSPYESNNFF